MSKVAKLFINKVLQVLELLHSPTGRREDDAHAGPSIPSHRAPLSAAPGCCPPACPSSELKFLVSEENVFSGAKSYTRRGQQLCREQDGATLEAIKAQVSHRCIVQPWPGTHLWQ
ncbi:hypothetical protein AV530_004936 [Patagioenas fasciata monilis]|uniref:Uncharacterized protein n=1 Tax=Patagioenas fasciata monilis TaxID=372326 RepID=A0A1V4K3D3_PATFA|nr:hypothetical protein AV530_004936 [Patagioenas fasciata monilis]